MVDALAWCEYPIDLEDGTTQSLLLGAVSVSAFSRNFSERRPHRQLLNSYIEIEHDPT